MRDLGGGGWMYDFHTAHAAKNHTVQQGVSTQAIGAVDSPSALSSGVQSCIHIVLCQRFRTRLEFGS